MYFPVAEAIEDGGTVYHSLCLVSILHQTHRFGNFLAMGEKHRNAGVYTAQVKRNHFQNLICCHLYWPLTEKLDRDVILTEQRYYSII